jgi:hypothetical protein
MRLSSRMIKPAGQCHFCGGYYTLRKNGTLRRHMRSKQVPFTNLSIGRERCPGSGSSPGGQAP